MKRILKNCFKKASHEALKEDRLYGRDHRGDEIPDELARRETRLAKIKQAKAALKEEARLAQEEDQKKDNDKNDDPPAPHKSRIKYKKKSGEPDPKAQRNFTDLESTIMKNAAKAFVQAYNAQAVVDSENQIIKHNLT